jgi:hypothetical protein
MHDEPLLADHAKVGRPIHDSPSSYRKRQGRDKQHDRPNRDDGQHGDIKIRSTLPRRKNIQDVRARGNEPRAD